MTNKLTPLVVVRSCLFWILSASVLPFYSIAALLIAKLPPLVRHRIIMSAARYYTFLFKYIGGINYQVSGVENLPHTPAIVAGNHQSAWETAAMNQFLPPCVWIMKKEIFKIPFYGWGVRALSTIAIDRTRGEDSLNQVISQGRQRFALGFWIIMFPEGTRVKPKVRKPFKLGCAKLALSLDVPIVPFAHNAGYCLPKNSFWIYPGTVSIVIGKPLYPDSADAAAYTKKVEDWIHNTLTSIGS